ncbi:MAG: hypothetical protein ACLR8Y_22895 [Alistipes indistinctus]
MFVIGTPLNITRVMTLLYDDLTPEQRARYEAAMNHYAPDVTYEGAATGANKVWQCAAMAARGFLTQDPAKLDMAVKGLETEFKTVTTSDGFYEDGSFVQHQWHRPYRRLRALAARKPGQHDRNRARFAMGDPPGTDGDALWLGTQCL